MSVEENLIPFLMESSMEKYNEQISMIYSNYNFNQKLINSYLDVLLKYEITSSTPSSKSKVFLTNFLINNHNYFPKIILYEQTLKLIAEKVLLFEEIVTEDEYPENLLDDIYWETISRNSLITKNNDIDLHFLFEEMCISLNMGNFIKSVQILHCIILNKNYIKGNDKYYDLFIKQAIDFFIVIKDFKLVNYLSWELILLQYARGVPRY